MVSSPAYDRSYYEDDQRVARFELYRENPSYRYRVAIRRSRGQIDHVAILWGYDEQFCRAIAGMMASRSLLRGYEASTSHDYSKRESRVSIRGMALLGELAADRLVRELHAAVRECRRIARDNRIALRRAA